MEIPSLKVSHILPRQHLYAWGDQNQLLKLSGNSGLSNFYCTESIHRAKSDLLNQKSRHILLNIAIHSYYK